MQFIKSCISLGSCTSTASQLIGSAVSRRTTITYAVTFTDAFGDTSTVASDKAVVTIARRTGSHTVVFIRRQELDAQRHVLRHRHGERRDRVGESNGAHSQSRDPRRPVRSLPIAEGYQQQFYSLFS